MARSVVANGRTAGRSTRRGALHLLGHGLRELATTARVAYLLVVAGPPRSWD